jgi:glycosyltransferase involved in cell wall biosynthesis
VSASRPLVSVITIFLNAERFLGEAIESVFAQRDDRWELLLVDDGSRDGSTALALGYADRHPDRVRYLEHADHGNRGMSGSRNLGVSVARGEYILFLDSDDVLLPSALAEQAALLEAHPRAAMVCGTSENWWGWTGRSEDATRDSAPPLGVAADTLHEPPSLATLCYPLGQAAAPCLCSVLVRREAICRLQGFDEAFPGFYEDQTFLVKMYLAEPVFVSSRCWSRYRQHEDSCSAVTLRAGGYAAARRRFLEWLEGYLRSNGVEHAPVWRALARAFVPYRQPVRYALSPSRWLRRARHAAATARAAWRQETRA